MSFVPDSVLRKAIDTIYMRYDKNHSNTLDKNELVNCFNQLLRMSGSKMQVNSFIMKQLLKRMDRDGDGVISKPEFLQMFRLFQSKAGSFGGGNQQPQQQQFGGNNGWGQQQVGYNQGPQQGWGNQGPQQNWGNQGPQQGWGNQGGYNQGGFGQGGYGQGGYGQGGYNQGW